jgi:hypothetical protein
MRPIEVTNGLKGDQVIIQQTATRQTGGVPGGGGEQSSWQIGGHDERSHRNATKRYQMGGRRCKRCAASRSTSIMEVAAITSPSGSGKSR